MILDSLGHPTISGKWLGRDVDASFQSYARELKENKFRGGLAVGLFGQDLYSHESYIQQVKKFDSLHGIAGVHPQNVTPDLVQNLKSLGYYGLKIHCRLSKVQISESIDMMAKAFQACEQQGFPVFYCTYMHSHIGSYPDHDPFEALVAVLKKAPNTKVVLVHGGDVSLLRYAELARFNSNLLVDLSLTIQKYAGSSLDQDIQFLFSKFDRRICVGSDHPEWPLSFLMERFSLFAKDLTIEKKENIAFRNLSQFLNIKMD